MPKKTKRRRSKRDKKRRKKRRKKRTRKLKTKCSPKNKNDTLPFTCYTSKGLHKIKNIWNKKHPDRLISSNNLRNIWESLQDVLNKSCNKESCWLKHKCISENIDLETKEYTFAPSAPKEWNENPNEWLTSVDILEVMKQYEKTYKCFDFIGPSPIDYDKHVAYGECVWEELCEFSLSKSLNEGKQKTGIIFNLDAHNKPGSHWVGMFIDSKRREIYYLDSYGEKIPKQIKKFATKVQKQSLNIGNKKEYKLLENKRRHQFSESECGMYSLYFIIKMLKGTTFKKFTSKRIKDSYMTTLRRVYFNSI
jgi:hypothetical protein